MSTGILINSETLAERLSVSKSWVQKNYRTLPHLILPNQDSGTRRLIRFDYNEVLDFLKNNTDKGGGIDE